MHVTPYPHHPQTWRMLYTGLSMSEQGRIQRVGAARSTDLYRWERVENGYPLEVPSPPYEASAEEGRRWVSFRDPFYFRSDGEGYLLATARVDHGPIIRRGCIALARETSPDHFEFLEPLYHPMRYDDLEVPGVFEIDGTHYLVASVREDIKVHYWYADDLRGPYRNFSDNVLMPQGNYAARVATGPDGTILVWNFFFSHGHIHGDHLLPPPKELTTDSAGRLRLVSFRGFDEHVIGVLEADALTPLEQLLGYVEVPPEDMQLSRLRSDTGFEAFLIRNEHADYRLTGTIHTESDGKFGLVMHLQPDGDGYYISIDPEKGVTQIRYWAARDGGTLDEAFEYEQLQASYQIPRPGPIPFSLIAYGNYIELSLYDRIALTLADDRLDRGRVGFYLESSRLSLTDLRLEELRSAATDPVLHSVAPPS
jgi:beta-fructofuranosidase